jgi:UDP-2,3-diacylglucosamine pyrophosphatase LpxH
MSELSESISTILARYEGNGLPEYTIDPVTYTVRRKWFFWFDRPTTTRAVEYNADGRDIFIVSDLHLGSGRSRRGTFPGTENFFGDEAFERFLRCASATARERLAVLILNGDTFDLIRNTEYPARCGRTSRWHRLLDGSRRAPGDRTSEAVALRTQAEYLEWQRELRRLGITKGIEELSDSIAKEKEYGLGTEDFKAIYKLMKTRQGHPAFFSALAEWLVMGNRLVFIKGNHDLELCHRNVRNYIRLLLADAILQGGQQSGDLGRILNHTVLPNVRFFDDSIVMDGNVRVEHGHRYDKFTMVLEAPQPGRCGSPIDIPFGSLFNRYVINRIEERYPFVDNLRPTVNVLAFLVKENFPMALKVLWQQLKAIRFVLFRGWKYFWYMLWKPLVLLMALLFPVVLAVLLNPEPVGRSLLQIDTCDQVRRMLLDQLTNVGILIISYMLSRIVSWLQLREPTTLESDARQKLAEDGYSILAMGHTHNPGQFLFENDGRFYDTGTWIPIIEMSTAELRQKMTYTFLHLIHGAGTGLSVSGNGLLETWNDDAERIDTYKCVDRA